MKQYSDMATPEDSDDEELSFLAGHGYTSPKKKKKKKKNAEDDLELAISPYSAEQQAMEQELIPGLPQDLALMCLARLPLRARARSRCISHAFYRTLSDEGLLRHCRLLHGITGHYLLFLCLSDKSSSDEFDTGTGMELVNNASTLWLILDPSSTTCNVIFDIQSHGSLRHLRPRYPIRMLRGHRPGQVLICGLVTEHFWFYPSSSVYEVLQEGDRIFTFDVVAGQWCPSSVLEGFDGRMDFAWIYLDESLYIAGGWSEDDDNDYEEENEENYEEDDDEVASNSMPNAERYNFITKQWEAIPNMLHVRQSCTGFAMNGCVYLLGGYSKDEQAMDSGEFFNPYTETWTLVPHMWPYEQPSPPCVAVVNDQLYAIRPHTTEIIHYEASQKCWNLFTYLPKYCKAAHGHRIAGVGDELWIILNHDDKSLDVIFCTPPHPPSSKPSFCNWHTPCFNLPKDLQIQDLVVIEI